MTIITKLIPHNNYNCPGTKQNPKRICIHYFGQAGTTAAKLNEFQHNVAIGMFKDKPESWTSSQYIVGLDGEIIRSVPDNEISYSASGNNQDTIHIECAHPKSDGAFTAATISALCELVRSLMKKYNIAADSVVRHYDLTGKWCPLYYVDNTRWAALHEKITSESQSSGKLYRVQVGAFRNKANAEAYMQSVKNAGFNAFVVEVT